MVTEKERLGLLKRGRVSRRDMLRAGGVAALGLAFAKPVISTIAPPPVYASISPLTPPISTTDICANGKPMTLSFLYTGDLCSASSNSQGSKAVCTDGATAASGPVEIIYTGKDAGTKIAITPGSGATTGEVINVGDSIVLTSSRTGKDGSAKGLHANSKFDIKQGGVIIQQLEIHTSCSVPLNVGDQFGSLQVTGFVTTP